MKLMRFLSFAMLVFALGCEDYDDFNVPSNLKVKDFIWKGMNLYYLWQPDVDDLADDRFENQFHLNEYLKAQPAPFEFFDKLRTDESIDRFSIIYSDYSVLEGILSGTTKNNGVDYGLKLMPGSQTAVFGWVRYILPNSDAATKDIHRGNIFYAVDGEPLTINNYRTLLAPDSYTLNLADYDNGNFTPNGDSVLLSKTVISENPVLVSNVIHSGTKKIAYIMYNGFYPNFESQLNSAFGQFKTQGVTDLVLDLRYNSGGSIATATNLASMITGQFAGQLFAKEQWNPKAQAYLESHNPDDLINTFSTSIQNGEPIQSLNMSRVYVLTSASTASASELVINCLEPYIDVVVIGDVTTGKNVGSITLYDSANFKKEGADQSHKYAMQPIVLQVVNKIGFGDYHTGLVPDHPLEENLADLGTIGSEDEPLLSIAIALISATGRIYKSPQKHYSHISDSKSLLPAASIMYRRLP